MQISICRASEKRVLTEYQESNAKKIADIVTDAYDEYGVLPSMAVAQALEETSLGVNADTYNWWGIMVPGTDIKEQYGSAKEGAYAYLGVINNGRYDGALFNKQWKSTIRNILDGGYCNPEGNYYTDVIWLYKTYNLEKYDNKLFKKLDKREKAKKRKAARKKAEREEKKRLEAERLEAERLEAERLEAERLEAERQEAERERLKEAMFPRTYNKFFEGVMPSSDGTHGEIIDFVGIDINFNKFGGRKYEYLRTDNNRENTGRENQLRYIFASYERPHYNGGW